MAQTGQGLGFKRKRYRRKYKKAKAKVPKPIAKYVKKAIRQEQETKFHDTKDSIAGFTINAGYYADLCLVPQSTTQSTDITRIGDHIKITGLELRAIMNPASTNVHHRLILFQWKPNSQLVGPTGPNILTYYTTNNSQSVLSPYYNDYENQYTILYDKTFEASNSVEDLCNTIVMKVPLKYAKRDLQYYSTTTAGSNHIFLLAVTNSSGTNSTISYVSRLYFTDS